MGEDPDFDPLDIFHSDIPLPFYMIQDIPPLSPSPFANLQHKAIYRYHVQN